MNARHDNGGLSKRCGCARRKWSKCSHPWHFDFYYGRKYRFSLHKLAGWPLTKVMSKTEAEAFRDLYRSQIRSGTFVDPNAPAAEPSIDTRLTFGDVADHYIKRHVRVPTRRPYATREMERLLTTLRNAEVPAARGATVKLDTKYADEVTKADVEAIREARRERGREAARKWKAAREAEQPDEKRPKRPHVLPGCKGGEAGINRLLSRLRHLFNWAIGEGYVTSTPFKRNGVTVIRLDSRAEAPRYRRLAEGEEERLLSKASPHLHALIIAALETGCRLGELLGLQWSDVESETGAEGELIAQWLLFPATKTKTNETRRVPVTPRLNAVIAMRRLDPKGKPFKPTAYVFGNEVGEEVKSIKTAWRATCRRANISGLHFHDLRREFGSRLNETPGVSNHQVRDWLGHANITTTSRYLATTPKGLRQAAEQFAKHRPIPAPLSQTENQAVPVVEEVTDVTPPVTIN